MSKNTEPGAAAPLSIDKTISAESAAKNAPCVILEWRGSKRDKMSGVKDGRAYEIDKLLVSAEFPDSAQQIALEVIAPRGGSVPDYPFRKGDLVLATLTHYENSRQSGCRGRAVEIVLFRSAS